MTTNIARDQWAQFNITGDTLSGPFEVPADWKVTGLPEHPRPQSVLDAVDSQTLTEVAETPQMAASVKPSRRAGGQERDVRAPATNKRGKYVETKEYVGFCRRAIRALTRRVGQEADVEGLPAMLELQAQLDEAITTAVAGLRSAGYSWDEIAARCGMKRQSAWERWSKRIAAIGR